VTLPIFLTLGWFACVSLPWVIFSIIKMEVTLLSSPILKEGVYADNMKEEVMTLFPPISGKSPASPTWRRGLWCRRYQPEERVLGCQHERGGYGTVSTNLREEPYVANMKGEEPYIANIKEEVMAPLLPPWRKRHALSSKLTWNRR